MDVEVRFLDPFHGWKCAVRCGPLFRSLCCVSSASAVVTAQSFMPLVNLALEQSSRLCQVANLLLGAYPGGLLVACLVPRYFPDGPFVSLSSGCRRCACRCHGVYLCRRSWSAYYPRGRILPAGLVSWRCTWRPISVPSVLRHCRWSGGVIVVILCIVRGVPCSNCACCGVGM